VWIGKGGYNDLLAFPALKSPERNNWPEEDGIEVDLSETHLEAKEVSIPFIASKPGKDANNFVNFVSAEGCHTLYVPTLNRTWIVRLAAEPVHKTFHHVTDFTLRFVQDVPLRAEATAYPGLPVHPSAYELDGIPFDHYGIVVESAREGVLKSPTAKRNLSREIETADGRVYDAGTLVFEAKDVAFKCCLKAASMENFWRCYDSFFHNLTKPGEREMYVDYTGEAYPCYYKSTGGWKLHLTRGIVLCEFTLTLVFTSFRVGETEYILASEDGAYITLEEDNETYIDMQYYGD
jgi:hypothetical protein